MTSLTAQCPECSTRFKVNDKQLTAYNGMVRCGRCSHVFNAAEQVNEEEQVAEEASNSQQPIEIQQEGTVDGEYSAETAALLDSLLDPSPAIPNEDPIVPFETIEPIEVQEAIEPVEAQEADEVISAETPSETIPSFLETAEQDESPFIMAPVETEELEHHFKFGDAPPSVEISKPTPKPLRWPWVLGSMFLLLGLTAQALYFYRVEVAARLPGLKPMLVHYCKQLQCSIPLPTNAELMSIESSDLAANPFQPNYVTLSALLQNLAPYAQAYPSLELSLTDIEDKIIARRTFAPSEYLKKTISEKRGLAAHREISIKLPLDSSDLKPSGYKLFLFYTR